MEEWIDRQRIYSGKIVSLWAGTVKLDDGRIADREVVEHPGGVAIVALLDHSVLLVRQYRISIGREVLELPAGKLDAQESPEACAARELQEELGYRASRFIKLFTYYSSVGFTNEQMHIFLGVGLQPVESNLEWDERITLARVPIAELETRLSANEFEDSKTLIGLYGLLAYLKDHS